MDSITRDILIDLYNRTCQYCERIYTKADLCIDHIFPKARGGTDSIENYTVACASCNAKKSDLILGEGFLQVLKAKAKRKKERFERIAADIQKKVRLKKKSSIERPSYGYPICSCHKHELSGPAVKESPLLLNLFVILTQFIDFLGAEHSSCLTINEVILTDLRTHLEFGQRTVHEGVFLSSRILLHDKKTGFSVFPYNISDSFNLERDHQMNLRWFHKIPECFLNLPCFDLLSENNSIRSLFPIWKRQIQIADQIYLQAPIKLNKLLNNSHLGGSTDYETL